MLAIRGMPYPLISRSVLRNLAEDFLATLTEPHAPGSCWVCGAPADSGEHRFKRTDLVLLFGPGPYPQGDLPVHVFGNHASRTLQSPDSKHIKYRHSLCRNCNNSRTQPADRAFDAFRLWTHRNAISMLATRSLDLDEVFQGKAAERVPELLRYYCKELGCRLFDAKRPIPVWLAGAVRGDLPPPPSLTVQFSVQEQCLALRKHFAGSPFLGRGDMTGSTEDRQPPYYAYQSYFNWIVTSVGYRSPVSKVSGTVLQAGCPQLELGTDTEGLPDEVFAQLMSLGRG